MLPIVFLAAAVAARAPVPIDPSSWIGERDYPSRAARLAQSGRVSFQLDVSRTGEVTRCVITTSSAEPLLDKATCSLLKARAHFVAAVDAAGKPAPSTYASSVRWTLPPAFQPTLPVAFAAVSMGSNPFNKPFFDPPARFAAPRIRRPVIVPPIVVPPPPPVNDPKAVSPPADPRVLFGTLPNGLRYAIMHNDLPHGGVSYRMQVGSGSLDEADDQRGYAHLMEHMTFRGTANVPDGQLERSLQAMGLSFGVDTTANTDFEHTTWSLDFPVVYRSTSATGLSLLREMAERAIISPAGLDVERRVVSAEERLRDSPSMRAEEARLGLLFAGQRIPTRWTIGTPASIASATAPKLREFYASHYRPDNVVLVVVGSVNPDGVEEEIKENFGDWARPATPLPEVDRGTLANRGTQVSLFDQPGAPESIELNWVRPYDTAPDTYARQRSELAELIAATIFNQRLARPAEAIDAPFSAAAFEGMTMFHSARVSRLTISPLGGQTARAIAAAIVEQRRLVRFGVAQAEVEEVVTALRAALAQQANAAESRSDADIAGALLNSFDTRNVFTTAAQGAADFERLAVGLGPDDIAAAAGRLFAGSGPLLFVSGSKPPPGGEPALRAVLAAAQTQPVAPAPPQAVAPWAYSDFGPPGKVIDRQTISDLNVTIARFANGTSVTIKPTPNAHGNISTSLSFGAGLTGLPDDLARSYWMLTGARDLIVQGGLGKASLSQIRRQLAGKAVDARFEVSEERFFLRGQTLRSDLDSQLQLLTAFAADPAFRAAPIAHARATFEAAMPQFDASPSATAARDLASMLHGGDPRWSSVPSAKDLALSRPEDLPALLRPALAGPLNLVIVGDVDVERAIASAAATIGALPPRTARVPSRAARFPAAFATPHVIYDHGRADQALAVAAWPTPGFFANMREARAMQVAAEIINARLLDGFREAEGLTYAPSVDVDQSETMPDYGMLAAQVEIAPDNAPLFFAEVRRIASDLAANKVSDLELTRASAPLLDQGQVSLYTVDYWLQSLARADDDPRVFDMIRTRMADLAAIGPADIQAAARKYLSGAPPFELLIRAAEPAIAPPPVHRSAAPPVHSPRPARRTPAKRRP